MKILMETNKSFDINDIEQDAEVDIRYCVLDYSDPKEVDFIFYPLVFLEEFTRPSVDLSLGKYRVQVPLDWSIVIADKNMGNLEIIELKHINDRPFQAFSFNPIAGYMPSFLDLEIVNIFPNVSWSVPKLKNGHLLAIPLSEGDEPQCAFFVKDTNKLSDSLDITKIF